MSIILNQPFQGQLGNIIIEKLSDNYKQITIFSAFAKCSGILRLKESLETFKKNGGKITAFIGIDLNGTSYEALLNLFFLCDSLYIVHSENISTTYHSKIYLLENDTSAWCAIGSNNLTGGGLWTNFESTSLQEYILPEQYKELENIYSVIRKYSDPNYACSRKITSVEDVNMLLRKNYISKEVSQKISSAKQQFAESPKKEKDKTQQLFGIEKVSLPVIIKKVKKNETKTTKNIVNYIIEENTTNPAFANEQFWFEMRESTGGSRNILDLSKLGKIIEGSVSGTPYEYLKSKSNQMYGGIKFFEINPEDVSVEKDITINYHGKDYYPSTIKFAPNNGSWRIQLKGSPDDGTDELSKFGLRGDFVHKILIFEKIASDYYVLSVLDESELDEIKAISHVWGRNGNNPNSKTYGML